ncbi:hypothetical protein ACROYT_G019613 [Oculina patagonica]
MEIAGLVVLLSRLMLTVAASAGVMDGTTTQSGIEVRVICLAGAMVTLGNKGQSQLENPVPCSTQFATVIYTNHHKTASHNNWEHTTSVKSTDASTRATDCNDKCKIYCFEEREDGNSWPGCVAFSSYVNSGGKCWCYGWDHKPTCYLSEGYRSGWCMAYIRRHG